jgi:hypothetical protein
MVIENHAEEDVDGSFLLKFNPYGIVSLGIR